MASESVPTLTMSNCTLGFEKPKLVPGNLQANVLEEIFNHFGVSELLQVRSTCRHWKETVDGCPELMKKVSINFPENLVFDRNYQPPATLVPAKNIIFEKSRISSVDSWWPSIGQRLMHLTLKDCQMSFSMLLKILKYTPELKSLDYLCPSYHAALTDFRNLQLKKLECLVIDVPNADILDIAIELRNLFPNLKSLGVLKETTIERLIEVQDSLSDILESIYLESADKLLDGSLKMNGLKSLKVSKNCTNEMLCKIGEAFPELNCLAIKTEQKITLKPTFLTAMEKLQNLTICGREIKDDRHIGDIEQYACWTKIDFSEMSNLQLEHISLIGIVSKPFTLHHYLKNSASVRALTFKVCWFESWSEIFTLAETFESLEQIELVSINVINQNYNLCEYFDKLKCLKIEYCTLPETMLTTLFSLCPKLKEIYLKSVKGITDTVIGEILKSNTKLQKLYVNECSITDISVEGIANSGLFLKHVAIQKCDKVSPKALEKLRPVKNI